MSKYNEIIEFSQGVYMPEFLKIEKNWGNIGKPSIKHTLSLGIVKNCYFWSKWRIFVFSSKEKENGF